jgi:hypothetical protein
MTPAEINQRNKDFWAVQIALAEERMADEVLRTFAFREMESEAQRGTPLYCRKTPEQALADAAALKSSLNTQKARQAAKARRIDALQELIEGEVQLNPRITWKQLLRQLPEAAERAGVSPSVAGNKIEFVHRGQCREAPISGLKDRLSRARRNQNSR